MLLLLVLFTSSLFVPFAHMRAQAPRVSVTSTDAEAAGMVKATESGLTVRTLGDGNITERTKELNAMFGRESDSGPAPAAGNPATPSLSPAPEPATGQAQPVSTPEQIPSSTSKSVSPDKKWEFKPPTENEGPEIVNLETNQAAGDLSDDCDIGSCGDSARVLWAPDSKRFAFDWGQGRTRQTSFYQLRGDHWEVLKPSPGDEALEQTENDVVAQAKRKGLSEEKLKKNGLYLRFISSEETVDRWINPNTALVYAGERKVIAKLDDPGEISDGLGADFLFTVKFDAGAWKIVKTHRMSEKEVEQRDKGE